MCNFFQRKQQSKDTARRKKKKKRKNKRQGSVEEKKENIDRYQAMRLKIGQKMFMFKDYLTPKNTRERKRKLTWLFSEMLVV